MTINSIFKNIWSKFRRRNTYHDVHYVDSMNEIPDRLSDSIYIVGLKKPKWVVMSCPCGCGFRLDVNLMTSHKPVWKLYIEHNLITLLPSLWVSKDRCGSHFFIEKNRVHWVRGRF